MTDAAPAYRADVDGLRGVAVLAVVAFHAFPRSLPSGFTGVDVFFVISGFLISSIVRDGIDRGTFTFRGFYARRIARIFPALVTVLLATIVLGWAVMLSADFRRLGLHTAAGGAFLANVALWRDSGYFGGAADLKPLLHLWSLGVEEQFYLVWPPLLLLVTWRRTAPLTAIVLLGAASFLVNVVTTPTDAQSAFYLPLSRLWELLLGAWLAYRASTQSSAPAVANAKAIVGLALVAVGVALVTPAQFPGWWALLPTVGAALLIAAGRDAFINRRVLAFRPLVFVGLISYPLYLWHWPLLSFARLTQFGRPSDALTLGIVALSAALAWATYRFVERPIRFGRFAQSPWRTPALATAMAFVTCMGVVVARDVVPARMDAKYRDLSRFSFDYRAAYRGGECHLSKAQVAREFGNACVDAGFGKPGRTSMVLWGDSHAAHLYPGMRALATSDSFVLAQFASDACPPVLEIETTACLTMSGAILERIRALRPDVVVLAARWSDSSATQAPATVRALRAIGVKRVIVVGPVPRWTLPLPAVLIRYLQRHPLQQPPIRLLEGLEREPFIRDSAMRAALEAADARYVSVTELLCAREGCLALVSGQPSAWDSEHLTDASSRLVARAILQRR